MAMKFNQLLVRMSTYLSNLKELTPYKALASAMGGHADRSAYLGKGLDIVLLEDHEQNQPHRSAMIVRGPTSAGAGLPGKGYFVSCMHLGLITDLTDHKALKQFWADQLKRLGVEAPQDLERLEFAF